MKLRKTGVCEDCGQTLYGDDYGASGHRCTNPPKTENEIRIETEIAQFAIREFVKKLQEAFSVRAKAQPSDPDMLHACFASFNQGVLSVLDYAESLLKQNSEGKES